MWWLPGPSLEKTLHLLKEAKSKAVIIAVDAALPTLLPAGILPDLLVAIDPMPENVAFFKDNPLLKHVPFMCLTQYTPEIVDIYPGPLFLNTTEQNLVTSVAASLLGKQRHCSSALAARLPTSALLPRSIWAVQR